MRIVTNTADLKALIAELSSAPYLALDTEFLRDQTYWPKLCLIQVASPGVAAIIDPLVDGIDLKPFYELLKNPKIVKVFHAARQDIEIFQQQGGVIPAPLFDTQVAAMVAGFGDAASYETLARNIARAEIDKSSRFTDWSRRPLTNKQLEYALGDVTHLRTIYETLDAELKRTHRESWVAEEISALQNPALYAMDPANAWKRLKARTTSKRFIAMLAALAAWREREAQTRDIPRGRVLKDEALLEIAAHPPETAEGLERIRAIPKGFANSRMGKTLMDAIELGRHAAPPEGIEPEKARRKREPSQAAIDLLRTLLRLRAEDARVAPRLIANAEDIESLAAFEDDGVAALHGWRAEVFGNDALALRKGELGIALSKGKAVVVKLDGAETA
ncbi:MAG TPA: ribonuclease D [Rhizomicrobium sp.]|nr:ribonuclease D [Rhizomicrobium sp.]